MEAQPHLLAAAPEDEVLAEMLALQNELLQQAAINRTRLVPALAGVLAEAPGRRLAAEARAVEEQEVKAWVQVRRGGNNCCSWDCHCCCCCCWYW